MFLLAACQPQPSVKDIALQKAEAAEQSGDYSKAIAIYDQLHNSNLSIDECKPIYLHLKEGNSQQASLWYKKKFNTNDAEALYRIGKLHLTGNIQAKPWARGCSFADEFAFQNFPQALSSLQLAAKLGHAEAMATLGRMYHEGNGVTQDYIQALTWYRQAAAENSAQAQFYLGSMYEKGEGVEQNTAMAIDLYEKSYKNYGLQADNDEDEQNWRTYTDTIDIRQKIKNLSIKLGSAYANGIGVAKDDAQAFTWFKKAADHNSAYAHLILGNLYYTGKGITQDFEQAKDHFGLARYHHPWSGDRTCDQKCQEVHDKITTEAFYMEGIILYEGKINRPNYDTAEILLREAAKRGHARAQQVLGQMYLFGTGVQKDPHHAFSWIEKAAKQGNVAAQSQLAWMYFSGTGVSENHYSAFEWSQKAAKQGDSAAQHMLGTLYLSGNVTPINFEQARYWYRKAAQQGHKGAIDVLKTIGW